MWNPHGFSFSLMLKLLMLKLLMLSDSDGNDDDDDDDDDDSRMRRQPLLNPLTLSCLRPPAKPWLLPAQILIVIYLHTLICMI